MGSHSQPPNWASPTGQLPPEAYQYTAPASSNAPPPRGPRDKRPLGKYGYLMLAVLIPIVAFLVGLFGGHSSWKTAGAPTATVEIPAPKFTDTATVTVTTTPTQVVSTAQVVTTVTFTPVPATAFADGVFLIGSDVPAGNYKTDGVGTSSQCYYAILNSSNTQDYVTNAIVTGPTRLTAPSGKYMQTRGGCKWTKA